MVSNYGSIDERRECSMKVTRKHILRGRRAEEKLLVWRMSLLLVAAARSTKQNSCFVVGTVMLTRCIIFIAFHFHQFMTHNNYVSLLPHFNMPFLSLERRTRI